jgi:hypothetical protein
MTVVVEAVEEDLGVSSWYRTLCVDEVLKRNGRAIPWVYIYQSLLSLVNKINAPLNNKHPIVVEQLSIVIFPALAHAWLSRSERHSVHGLAETRWQ